MLNNETMMDMMLPHVTPVERFERLATDLYTVVNFDEVLEDIHKKGLCMEEGKEFYAGRVISDLEVLLKGKTKEEIAILLRNIYDLMPV